MITVNINSLKPINHYQRVLYETMHYDQKKFMNVLYGNFLFLIITKLNYNIQIFCVKRTIINFLIKVDVYVSLWSRRLSDSKASGEVSKVEVPKPKENVGSSSEPKFCGECYYY